MSSYNLKMSPKEFMFKVIELYVKARSPAFYHPKIKRGRSHAISGLVEDLLAAFLAFNLTGDYDLYVDQPIILGNSEISSVYPDITLVKGDSIVNLIDVKMDLGWIRRGFIEFCEERDRLIDKIKGKEGKIKDGITKEQKELSFSENLEYHVVLVSELNISPKQLEKNKNGVSGLSNVKVYFLSGGIHPNTYNISIDEILGRMKIKESEFQELIHSLTINGI